MQQVHLQATTSQDTEDSEHRARWQRIKSDLEAQQEAICNEIYSYPPPIPACDQQYNYLLEQRMRVKRELRRLDALLAANPAADPLAASLEKFVRASAFLDETSVLTTLT
jgi:hypothetical protein